jgi:hypothetical protein
MTNLLKTRRGSTIAKKIFLYGILPCVILVLTGFVWICFDIRSSVKDISAEAVQEYPGDRVQALISYVESEKHSLRDRNRAVWALGQIGDRRALSVLEKYHSGEDCNHDKYLCQHEINKAINLCKGGLNLTSWLPM